MIIINADDFGRSVEETNTAAALVRNERVTSVSAMVFMRDSERAADVAADLKVEVGLHLNFSERWNGDNVPGSLAMQQESLVSYLGRNPYARLVYNPGLRHAFRDVYEAQVEEFRRLYGRAPSHLDGHHHQHLCANMLINPLIPRGCRVRRNFTFEPGEKGILNRAYRRFVDACLRRRYVLTDHFFSLQQCLSGRGRPLRRVADLAKTGNVELMTHPRNAAEYDCLTGSQFATLFESIEAGNGRQDVTQKRVEEYILLGALVANLLQAL